MADGIAYVAHKDVVDTLDAASGALLRRYEMGVSTSPNAPAVDEEVMYLLAIETHLDTNGLNLIALDLASGATLWRYPTEPLSDAPVVAEGVVYVGTVGPAVYASDAVSGELLWRFSPREDSSSSLPMVEGAVPFGAHFMSVSPPFAHIGLFAAEGLVPAGRQSTSISPPSAHIAVADGVVYAGEFDGILYALDAVSGNPLWSAHVGYMTSAPAVVEKVLYVGSVDWSDSLVHALDAASGERFWRYRMVGGFVDTPTVADGVVYVSLGEGHVYALDAAGGELFWYFRTGEGWTDAPTIVDGVVYIASSNGVVYALRPAAVE